MMCFRTSIGCQDSILFRYLASLSFMFFYLFIFLP